ncbi:hypothetical protein OESDEN_23504, partial [Oesophagostomum dentatum]
MHKYMRAMAVPNVKMGFTLKYPEYAWSDDDRKEIFVGYLEGEAKLQYKTLPKRIREGPFKGVLQALKDRLRVDMQGAQARALSGLRTLRKRDGQSVLSFCLKLELLSEKAHPSTDDKTMTLIRAQILYEQLKQWPEAYHLAEILDEENGRK